MKVKAIVAVLGLAALMASGCVGTVPGADVKGGAVVFSAEAVSVVVKQGDPLSLLEAQEAAGLMAKAKLLEKVKGQFISSAVKVGDLMFESQEATAATQGFLSRATVEYEMEGAGPEPSTVRAIATLAVPACEMDELGFYVQ